MIDENKKEETRVQADNNSIAVGNISAGGNIGNVNIHTGYTSEQVSVLIAKLQSTFQSKPFDGRCPYKGLDVFEEEDAELFFGREKLVDDLVNRVKDSRTVFVTGPSGSGKSSLVRAGLIHSLKQGAIKGSDRWLYATIKPGRDPIGELGRVVSSLASSTNPEDEIRAKAMKDATIFARWCEITLKEGRDKRLVLFIDQFEEVFTQISNEEERVAFLNLLTHAAITESGRVIILFSMRSDFVSNCATYPQLNAILNQQFVQIGAMQPEELVSAIAQPALRVRLRIDPDLIAQIINEMKGEPGALPLMQFALNDLFDSQQEKSGVIALTLNDYLQRGGIHKALERHADDSFSKLNKNEQELARSIFSGLIEIGRGTQDTKRTALLDELVPSNTKTEDVESIVQKLADARLITTDEAAGKDTVTISHEKLIDAWPWLKKLVNENRDVIALQNEIKSDAKEWDEHQRDNSYLYSGARLAVAQEKIKDLVLSENAQTYLTVSKTVEENSRLQSKRIQRRVITGLLIFSTIVLGLFLFSLLQLNISRAQRLGAQAQVAFAEENYNAALLYAYQANLIYKNDSANLVLGKLPYTSYIAGKGLTGHIYSVTSIAWSTDGRLASADSWGDIIIWDLKTHQVKQTLKGPVFWINSIAWSTDGRLASADSSGEVIIWDLKTGQPAQILKDHSGYVTSVAWSTDGRLASGSNDKTVIVWDLKTGQPAQILKEHSDYVTSVAWSTDGRLASGSNDNTVIIWDLKTGKPAHILKGHSAPISSIDWSIDNQLASGSKDKTVIIWNIQTGKPIQTLTGHTFWVNSVAWSKDGRLASGSSDESIIIWDIETGAPAQRLKGHTDSVNSVAWSTDGRLVSGSEDSTVVIWNLKKTLSAQTLTGHTNYVNSIAWSADGQLASGSDDNTVITWDFKSGEPAQILKGHTSSVTSVAWSVDGRLASGSNDNTIIIWDLNTGLPAQILKGHTDSVTSVAWSPDGQLASGSKDSTVIIWDLNTGLPAQILKGQLFVNSVAWSMDGRLASNKTDIDQNFKFTNVIIVWDLKTGKPAQILNGHTDPITSVAWSTDGRLASGSSISGLSLNNPVVIIWDFKTGKPAQILKGHKASVTSVTWSTEGRLASGSEDNTVIIWDIKTGQPDQTLKGHTYFVTSVAWSTDGRLISGSKDNTVKIAPAELLISGNICNVIFRNMTMWEWVSFQRGIYIYQPVCKNLPDPANTFYFDDLLFTWTGRVILLLSLLIFLTIIFFILRACYKLAIKLWRRERSRKGIQT